MIYSNLHIFHILTLLYVCSYTIYTCRIYLCVHFIRNNFSFMLYQFSYRGLNMVWRSYRVVLVTKSLSDRVICQQSPISHLI